MHLTIKSINYIVNKLVESNEKSTICFVYNQYLWKKRNTGEELFEHSYRMFCNCVKLGIFDEVLLDSILLHDIVEDWWCDLNYIEINFWYEVFELIKVMTCIDWNGEKYEKNKYFKIFQNYCKNDWRILFVKLFDCIDNLETIDWIKEEKREKFINEKKEIFLPIFEKHIDNHPLQYKKNYIKKLNEMRDLLN